jgi:hypothetical protein
MNYSKSDVVADFARRTRDNLRVVEALAPDRLGVESEPKVWEFTQLVNSLLGLLVFPEQEWFDELPDTPLDEMPEPWCNLEITCWDRRHRRGSDGGQLRDKTFREVAICLRNSIAHFNAEFEGDSRDEIDKVRLWNSRDNRERNTRDFEVVLGVATLREIAMTFVDQMVKSSGSTAHQER